MDIEDFSCLGAAAGVVFILYTEAEGVKLWSSFSEQVLQEHSEELAARLYELAEWLER